MRKSQAQKIATLINATTVYYGIITREINSGDFDHKEVRNHMKLHDDAAKELNAILGVVAVQTYDREEVF